MLAKHPTRSLLKPHPRCASGPHTLSAKARRSGTGIRVSPTAMRMGATVARSRESLGLHQAGDPGALLLGRPTGCRAVGLAAAHERRVEHRCGADVARRTEEDEVL
eukprot:scaffold51459_cov62-Phaeocystis_antarctica.AAC.8